jgi:hypothetical protein
MFSDSFNDRSGTARTKLVVLDKLYGGKSLQKREREREREMYVCASTAIGLFGNSVVRRDGNSAGVC